MAKELTAFRVAPELMAAMRRVKDRDGVPISVQVDKALRAWLTARGALKRPTRPKARQVKKGGQ
jgi:hypothetical protein